MNQQFIKTISGLEEKLRQAMSSSDIDMLSALLSDDLVFTTHTGVLISKQDDLEMHSSGDLEIKDIQVSDQKIMPYENIVIVTVRAEITGSYKGSSANGNFRFTRVWRKSSEETWQIIAGHASVVA